jgi:predicted deacylase
MNSTFPAIFDDRNWYQEIDSGKPGPITALLGCVHGDEVAGLEALRRIPARIDCGKLFLVGGNPRAYAGNVRSTEENLNRCFGEDLDPDLYEVRVARRIQDILDECDYALDIHQAFGAEVFTFSEQNSLDFATQLLTTEYAITLPENNSLNRGSTDRYMSDRGKIGICLEAGDMNAKHQDENITRALGEARRFLSLAGNILTPVETRKDKPQIIEIYHLYKTHIDFKLSPCLEDFQVVPKNALVGTDGENEVSAPETSILLFSQDQESPGEEAFQLARYL